MLALVVEGARRMASLVRDWHEFFDAERFHNSWSAERVGSNARFYLYNYLIVLGEAVPSSVGGELSSIAKGL